MTAERPFYETKTTIETRVVTGSVDLGDSRGTDTRSHYGRGNKMLAFTDDEWETIKFAVTRLRRDGRQRLMNKSTNKHAIRRDVALCKSILAKLVATPTPESDGDA